MKPGFSVPIRVVSFAAAFVVGALALPARADTYVWEDGAWSQCSTHCGDGEQTRVVSCRNATTGMTVDDFNCAHAGAKPAVSQPCNDGPCPGSFGWVEGTWSACSTPCGQGTQTRDVTCQDSNTHAIVDDFHCTAPKPASSDSCNNGPCPGSFGWVEGTWSACSTPCGQGTQTRDVTCQDSNTHAIVDDFHCTAPKPASSDSCNNGPCPGSFGWVEGTWSACSTPCGQGTQTRDVTCQDSNTHAIVDDFHCTAPKPASSDSCNNGPCPGSFGWVEGTWSACSTPCGQGTQTRDVTCQDSNTHAIVDDFHCTAPKPASSDSCNNGPCPGSFGWVEGTWSTCSTHCGEGTQTRDVTCQDSNTHAIVDDFHCTAPKPVTSRSCNNGPCPGSFGWSEGTWSACSTECGEGTQTRDVTCQDSTTHAIVDDFHCTAPKPVTSRSCNSGPCEASYAWSEGTWSACSTECGDGVQTRDVTCQDAATHAVTDSANCAGPRPATEKACSNGPCHGEHPDAATTGCSTAPGRAASHGPALAVLALCVLLVTARRRRE